jgi:uncharacterized repeat protein (TIGR03843 family)
MNLAPQTSQLIIENDLEIVGRLVDASNATLLAQVTPELKVIYKPIAGERPLWDFPEGSLAGREVAAYYISELGKFGLVPFTTMRDGPYGVGAVQIWIDTDEELDVVELAQQELPPLRSMALFDAIINNTDRKFGHILFVDQERIYGVDHGVSFHVEDKLRTVLWQWSNTPLTTDEISQLHEILENLDEGYLETLISPAEISALRFRIARLLENGVFPEPSSDWPAVPWPPY